MSGSILCRCGHEHVDPLELGAASMACGTCNCRSFREKPVPKRVAPSAETRVSGERLEEIRKRCDSATAGPWNFPEDENVHNVVDLMYRVFDGPPRNEDYDFILCARQDIPDLLAEIERLKIAPPAATNCCTATEVAAARNPKRTLEERAQEAAEEIVQYFLAGCRGNRLRAVPERVKAIILSRIGGAE